MGKFGARIKMQCNYLIMARPWPTVPGAMMKLAMRAATSQNAATPARKDATFDIWTPFV